MKNKYACLIVSILILSFSATAQNEKLLWSKVSKTEIENQPKLERSTVPEIAKFFKIDLEVLKSKLTGIARRGMSNDVSITVVQFPLADGELHSFEVREASIFESELQSQFPDIRSYSGVSVDDKKIKIRFSLSPNGFHGMLLNTDEGTVYIDPYSKDKTSYMVYDKKDLSKTESDFVCGVENTLSRSSVTTTTASRSFNDGNLRTFRLALACTGEYAQYHLTEQGVGAGETDAVKKAAVLAAMNTTMTRVNGIYENDLSVTMTLVANNTDIIYLDAGLDPYTNTNVNTMLGENQTNLDAVILDANYDIGHVFGHGSNDGVANVPSACRAGHKAKGVTKLSDPLGDVFDVDYVSHEMGHQFDANHTFNNSCGGQRVAAVAYEPGSGSTIMAYAGVCTPNVQNTSDAYFHVASLQEMWAYITTGLGSCATTSSTGNTASPTISAIGNYSIPKSTPFVLKGNGTDADGNGTLTFGWEQIDNEIATMPPSGSSTTGPVFRSLSPTSSSDRYMPAIETVISGNTASTWEVVPDVARDMEFNLTVRDNDASGGRFATETMTVSTVDIDPFVITAPLASVIWGQGTTKTITWDVGSTTTSPVNVSQVNIKLSTDGGLTYPITILSNTQNDGSQDITVPNNLSTTCRIMVEAVGNIFYNINPVDFTIDTVDGGGNYCASTFSVFPSNYISNVTFGTIDNDSGNGTTDGYEDFTSVNSDVEINTTYQIDVTINTAGNFTDYCEVYIDWNKDYLFDPITEYYDLGSVTNTTAGVLSTNITVPSDAVIANTRMRVVIQDFPNSGACLVDHDSSFGETEDYTLNVTNGLSVDDEIFEEFSLYPNPSTGAVTVSFRTESFEKIKLSLFDVLGRTIANKTFNSSKTLFTEQVQFNDLNKGVYLLRISQGKSSTTKQLVIN